jgi:hypothetical protein
MPPIPARHRHTIHSLRHLFSYPIHPLPLDQTDDEAASNPSASSMPPECPAMQSPELWRPLSSQSALFSVVLPWPKERPLSPTNTLIPGPPDASRMWMKMRWTTIHGRLHQQRSLRERAFTMHTLDTNLCHRDSLSKRYLTPRPLCESAHSLALSTCLSKLDNRVVE